MWAAEASECASDQGAFWEYHDKLFDSQKGENQGAFSIDNLKGFAVEMGLDAQTFNECMDNETHRDRVLAETNLARQIGVNSTPAFAINGVPVMGAQPFENFQQIIDPMLQDSGQ